MNHDQTPTNLISPVSRSPLFRCNDCLTTADNRETFRTDEEIILLLQTSEELRREIDIFDNLPVEGISYFRSSLYRQMIVKLITYLPIDSLNTINSFCFAELGGGAGHCARHIAEQFIDSEVYICDISRNSLALAPAGMHRICADITLPIFEKGSLDAAVFWVSLHHIPHNQRRKALEEAYLALKEGGILILFEPNDAFIIRRLLYQSSCRHDVYFDEQESAVDFCEVAALADDIGFMELGTFYLNPPYNPAFIRKLKRWWIYLPAVELLYQAGLLIKLHQSGIYDSFTRYAALYGLSIFQKKKS